MKALVVYESMFGNTETIARAIASGLGDACDVTLADVTTMPYPSGVDLLVVGGPTHAFGLSRPGTRQDAVRQGGTRPDAAKIGLREYLDACPMLTGLAAAAFDTRVDKPFLPGSAARKADRQLRRLGCRLIVPPASFRVAGTPGPLVDGEAERAARWAVGLAAILLTDKHRV
jgi:hypothetical protein